MKFHFVLVLNLFVLDKVFSLIGIYKCTMQKRTYPLLPGQQL